jgi:hypothetical protein
VLSANCRLTETSADCAHAQISIPLRSGLQTAFRGGTGEPASGRASQPLPSPIQRPQLAARPEASNLFAARLMSLATITGSRCVTSATERFTDRLRLLLGLPHGSELNATETAGNTFSAENTGARHRNRQAAKQKSTYSRRTTARRFLSGGWSRSWHRSSITPAEQFRRSSEH